MKRALHSIIPLLLAAASLALPSSSVPYCRSNSPYQAVLQVNGVSDGSFLDWEQPPNPNSTHHLIFYSVSGLLQRWPNTFCRNGTRGISSVSSEAGSPMHSDFDSCALFHTQATLWCLRLSPRVQFYTMDVPTIMSQMVPSGLPLILNTPIYSAPDTAGSFHYRQNETSICCTSMDRARRRCQTDL
jgi:hypothetical protein